MSVHLLSRAFYTDLPAHLKLTLLALADEANDDGTSICIGQRKLATKCGVSERAARDHLKDLVARGVIHKLAGKHPLYQTDQYEIATSRLGERPPPAGSSGRMTHDVVAQTSSINITLPPAGIAGGVIHRKPSVLSTGSGLPPTQVPTLTAASPLSTTAEDADSDGGEGLDPAAGSSGKSKPEGSAKSASTSSDPNPHQPTHDQLYLAERIGEGLTIPAIVKLNKRFGRTEVEDAMRTIRGFPPDDLANAMGYLVTLLEMRAAG